MMIESDVEMGGSDQLFNNLVGRDLQEGQGKPGQAVIVTPLLVGTDGSKKMSKSLGNFVGVTDPPSGQTGMFGKIMSIPDALMESYYTLLTDLPLGPGREVIAKTPREAKISLAKEIITWLHSAEEANRAEAEFVAQFSHKQKPTNIPEVRVGDLGPGPHKIAPLLVLAGLVTSNGEGVRKVKEGAVSVDDEKVTDFQTCLTLDKPIELRLGRKYVRLVP